MIKIKKVKAEKDYYKALNIRLKVFCDEQNIDIHEELDSKDKHAIHYLILENDTAVGTCRYLKEKSYYLIGRVAILSSYRKKGYGSQLIQKVIKDILKKDKRAIIELHAQYDKQEFYQKLGFAPFKTPFLEANIQHIGMRYQEIKK